MQRILLGLLISYLIVVGATAGAGFWVHDADSFAVHFALGLFATILTCLIFCVVLTYFVITGKMIKQATLVGHLDQAYIQEPQRAKAKIVSLAVLAVFVTLLAALLGAWANVAGEGNAGLATLHMIAELLAVAWNVFALVMCYQHVRKNAQLVERVFGEFSDCPGKQSASAP